ncbi:hypothetical protein GCM10010527_41980 [Streptomyces drozdowiczii]
MSRRAVAADSGREGSRTSSSVGFPNNSSALNACSSSTAGILRAAVALLRGRGCSTPSRPAMLTIMAARRAFRGRSEGIPDP